MDKQDRDRLLSAAMYEYGHYLTRLAYAFIKDKSKAEDIVQEVFIRYYLHLVYIHFFLYNMKNK